MNVGDMNLDHRKLGCLQRVEQRDRRERISGGIDDDSDRMLASLMNPIDQLSFVIGLAKNEVQSESRTSGGTTLLDLGEGGAAVKVRFARSQQIEVGTVENVDAAQFFLQSNRVGKRP